MDCRAPDRGAQCNPSGGRDTARQTETLPGLPPHLATLPLACFEGLIKSGPDPGPAMSPLPLADIFFETRTHPVTGEEMYLLRAMPVMLAVLCILAIAYR